MAWVVLAMILLALPAFAHDGVIEGVRLVDCYDGDTCTFTIPGLPPVFGEAIPVRLRGVDTPEIRGQCAAERRNAIDARDRLRSLLAVANVIELVNVERGKYFRLVADVLADGMNVSEALVREGLGRPYGGGTREGWCE